MMTTAMGEASLESWERHTAAGFRALSRSLRREAADEWAKSIDDLTSTENWDARLAAAMNNAGVGCLLEAKWTAAAGYLGKARDAWARTEAHIPELEVPIVGRSSAFHFRLATRHQDAFAANRRRRCAMLCNAASAITDFNAGVAARHTAAGTSFPGKDISAIVRALSDAFGPRCPELQLIGARDDATAEIPPAGGEETDALYEEKARRVFELMARSMSAALSPDYRRFEMATNLTALLSPRLLPAYAGSPSDIDGSEK